MTNFSLNHFVVTPIFQEKGNSYGKASRKSPSPHSFRQLTRSGEPLYSNRANVLSKEATLYSFEDLK